MRQVSQSDKATGWLPRSNSVRLPTHPAGPCSPLVGSWLLLSLQFLIFPKTSSESPHEDGQDAGGFLSAMALSGLQVQIRSHLPFLQTLMASQVLENET